MPKFAVMYVKGRAVTQDSKPHFEAYPGTLTFEVDAENRAGAYVLACKHLNKLGMAALVEKDPTGESYPLGFTDSEVRIIEKAKSQFHTEIVSGARIIKIVVAG